MVERRKVKKVSIEQVEKRRAQLVKLATSPKDDGIPEFLRRVPRAEAEFRYFEAVVDLSDFAWTS